MKRIIFLDTYGTDKFTVTAISSIQRSEDREARSRSLAIALREAGNRRHSESIGRDSGQQEETSDRTGNNGNPLANTEGKGEETEKFITPQGEVYGFVDKEIQDETNDRQSKGGLGAYDRLSRRDETTQGKHNSNSCDVTERGADRDNVGLDKETQQGESQQAQSDASSQKHQRRVAIKYDFTRSTTLLN